MNTVLLSWTLLWAAAPPLQTAEKPDTLLYVRTTPSGAEIRLEGKPLGKSDDLFPVKAGRYKIVVDLEGHQPKEQNIIVRDGRITRIELTLQQRPQSSRGAPPRSSAAQRPVGPFDDRLELRIAPAAPGQPGAPLDQEAVDQFVKHLQDSGPLAGRTPEAPYAWFELRAEPSEGLITSEYQGTNYVLLSNRPDEVMLALRDGSDAWGLTMVYVTVDSRGAPTICVMMDEPGGRCLAKLTESHRDQRLAMLLCDQVVGAPVIRNKISHGIEITGNFTRREAEELAAAMKASLRRNAATPSADEPSSGAADEAAVRKVIVDFADAAVKVDRGAVAKCLCFRRGEAYNTLEKLDEIPLAVQEGLKLTEIQSVDVRRNRALVVIERGGRPNDPEFSKCLTYTLVKMDGEWLIEDFEMEREEDVADVVRRFNEEPAPPLPDERVPSTVAGVVLSPAGDGLVEISLGKDDGLRKGQPLIVYRGGEQGPTHVYIGRIEVVTTEADTAVCRIEPKQTIGSVRRGDRVRRLLPEPPEAPHPGKGSEAVTPAATDRQPAAPAEATSGSGEADAAAVRKVIADFAEASVRSDVDAALKLMYPIAGVIKASLGLEYVTDLGMRGLKIGEIRRVTIVGDRALVVNQMTSLFSKSNAPAPVCMVFTLVKAGKSWLIRDIELEDQKGVDAEIRPIHKQPDDALDTCASPPAAPLVITVGRDGSIQVGNTKHDENSYSLKLAVLEARKKRPELSVVARCDRHVPFQRISALVELLQSLGVTKFSISTIDSNESPKSDAPPETTG